MLTFCPCGCAASCSLLVKVQQLSRRRAQGQYGASSVRDEVVLGQLAVSVRWQQLQSAAMGLNCGRWMDRRWYSVCHVGPNDMRWTWWSASPNRPKEQAVSARAAAETLSVHRGPRQRHVCNVRQRPAKHPYLIPPPHPGRGSHATVLSRCMVKLSSKGV
jgi:hypothetical protein